MGAVIGQVSFKCMITCDECETRFDALDSCHNEEGEIADVILDKETPNDRVSFEVYCPHCSCPVEVEGVEWY